MIKQSIPQKTEKSIMCMKKLSFIVRDFNIPSSVIARADKQKISKNKVYLNSMINHLDPISIGRLVYPNREEYTFFSRLHGTFSKINHITVHIKKSSQDGEQRKYTENSVRLKPQQKHSWAIHKYWKVKLLSHYIWIKGISKGIANFLKLNENTIWIYRM